MAFLDELKDRAADVAQVTGKKVGEAYTVTKLKVQIADKLAGVRTLYRELGEIVYENSKQENADTAKAEDKIAEIDLALDVIEELKSKERELRSIVVCPTCNENVDSESNFCPNCGNEMEK